MLREALGEMLGQTVMIRGRMYSFAGSALEVAFYHICLQRRQGMFWERGGGDGRNHPGAYHSPGKGKGFGQISMNLLRAIRENYMTTLKNQ